MVHKIGMLWNIGKQIGTAANSKKLSWYTNFQPNLRGRVIIAANFAWNDPLMMSKTFPAVTEHFFKVGKKVKKHNYMYICNFIVRDSGMAIKI